MINVLLVTYNTYYNRIVRKLETVQEYRVASFTATNSYIDLENVNFVPGDGVTTELVVGKGTGSFLDWDKAMPNYVVVYDKTTDSNNVTTELIKSRWFIMDENRTRGGQYKLSLKRDLMADYIENLKTVPVYVEKGIISDIEDPLLCNNESLKVNQIKKEEILLKDDLAVPWLVMYLQKGVLGNNTIGPDNNGKFPINIEKEEPFVYETLATDISQWSLYDYADDPGNSHTHTANYRSVDNLDVYFRVNYNQNIGTCHKYKVVRTAGSGTVSSVSIEAQTTNYSNLSKSEWQGNGNAAMAALDQYFKTYYSTLLND